MMESVIPRGSGKSVHPSSSAEDDGWTDLSLWMILNDKNDFKMMESVIPRGSGKSVHPSPSAEDDGWTDLSL